VRPSCPATAIKTTIPAAGGIGLAVARAVPAPRVARRRSSPSAAFGGKDFAEKRTSAGKKDFAGKGEGDKRSFEGRPARAVATTARPAPHLRRQAALWPRTNAPLRRRAVCRSVLARRRWGEARLQAAATGRSLTVDGSRRESVLIIPLARRAPVADDARPQRRFSDRKFSDKKPYAFAGP